ncbi:sulfite exporter TauE/SafE family protein [Leucobacter sp. CSA1]|uniref:Probable membrane transporter protein n=1 Tax=Leucobacter chromiisoli TaxID=2796471 RepID=A0A934UVZ5_9MICO|nr:sulfite exporter TauE/SafE family protein [Leucobacter chromiisoli]MBK0419402.1 sulfite exporter TauE/SafE family protein [Leucobacter chromiisoli]
MTWLFALLFVTVGAALQRVTGLGFTLVSGPLLVLVLDPFNGIALANILSAVIAALVLARTFRNADWRAVGTLLAGIAVGLPLGALVVHSLPPEILLIVVGSLTGLAVLLALLRRSTRIFAGRLGTISAGALSGFSNVTAGVGGPALALYGVAAAMPMQVFIPTVQAVGLATNLLSVAAKPQMAVPLPLLLGSLGCIAAGLAIGSLLQGRIPARRAQVLALALALLGSAAATARGVIALLA